MFSIFTDFTESFLPDLTGKWTMLFPLSTDLSVHRSHVCNEAGINEEGL